MRQIIARIKPYIRKGVAWFESLSPREKTLTAATAVVILIWAIYMPASYISENVSETKQMVAIRTGDLEELSRYLGRYRQLSARLDKLKASFEKSQITFEELTKQLDKIVKDSSGKPDFDGYELKRRDPKQLGNEYEKQDVTLTVKSFTLEQLVKLLHQLEQGEAPLFLGKVEVRQTGKKGQFQATLEIASLRKKV